MDEEEAIAPEVQEEGVDALEVSEEIEQPQPVSVDDLASEMGWKPQDQWKGDPDKWKPSDEFMRRTVDVNRNLSGKLRGLEEQVTHMARTSATIAEQAVRAEREKVLAEKQEAFDIGDAEAFNRADKKLETLNVPIVPQVAPEAQDFAARNKWFNEDDEATRWAINRAGELGAQGLGPARQLAIVEREAKAMFPELFPAPVTPAKGPDLNRPGPRGGAPQIKKGFSSLPADVQKAALEYEGRKVCSREEYAKIYYDQGVAQ